MTFAKAKEGALNKIAARDFPTKPQLMALICFTRPIDQTSLDIMNEDQRDEAIIAVGTKWE